MRPAGLLAALITSRSARKTGTIDLQIFTSLSMGNQRDVLFDHVLSALYGSRGISSHPSCACHLPKCFGVVAKNIAATSSYQWCSDRVGGRTKRSALAKKASSIVLIKDRCIVSSASPIERFFVPSERGRSPCIKSPSVARWSVCKHWEVIHRGRQLQGLTSNLVGYNRGAPESFGSQGSKVDTMAIGLRGVCMASVNFGGWFKLPFKPQGVWFKLPFKPTLFFLWKWKGSKGEGVWRGRRSSEPRRHHPRDTQDRQPNPQNLKKRTNFPPFWVSTLLGFHPSGLPPFWASTLLGPPLFLGVGFHQASHTRRPRETPRKGGVQKGEGGLREGGLRGSEIPRGGSPGLTVITMAMGCVAYAWQVSCSFPRVRKPSCSQIKTSQVTSASGPTETQSFVVSWLSVHL